MRDPIWSTAELVAQGMDPEDAAVMIALEAWPENLVDRWTGVDGTRWEIWLSLPRDPAGTIGGPEFRLEANGGVYGSYEPILGDRRAAENRVEALRKLRKTYLDKNWPLNGPLTIAGIQLEAARRVRLTA